jgi:hypothetical protein
MANLSMINTGPTAGPMLLQVMTNNSMHFATSNQLRMTLDAAGALTINNLAPGGLVFADATGKLTVSTGTALGTGTPGYFPRWNAAGTGLTATSNIFESGTNVGIGTTTPAFNLTFGGQTIIGINPPSSAGMGADMTLQAANAFGLNQSAGRLFIRSGQSTGTAGGSGISSIHFMTSPGASSGVGLNNYLQVANFTDDGRLTVSKNFGSTSVAHLWSETNTEQMAVYAQNRSTSGNSYGTYGEASGAAANNYGLYGTASGATGGGINAGVFGTAVSSATASAYGVYGNAAGSGQGWAGYFTGANVYVENRLGVGIGALNPLFRFHSVEPLGGGRAVYGENTFIGNNDGQGVSGRSVNNPGFGYGTFGVGGYMGSYSEVQGGNYTTCYGVYGNAIGTTGTRYGVYGTASGGATNYGVFCNGAGGYTLSWSAISDRRFKENIQPVTGVLSQLMKLEPVTYTFKQKEYDYLNFSEGRQFGLIAQEVEKVFPELVLDGANPGKLDVNGRPVPGNEITYKTMNYIALTPILVQAVKEQQQQIEEMKKQLEEQKLLIDALIKKQQ